VYRWVQTFTPELIDAARPARRAAGDGWFVDETCITVAGRWNYLYRAVDQHGQVIDVLASTYATLRPHDISSPARCDAPRFRWKLSPTGRRLPRRARRTRAGASTRH
jgi:DDE domain